MNFNCDSKEFNIPVKDLDLPSRVYACREGATLQEAILMMQSYNMGCLIVSNEKRDTLGIITERDFIFKVLGKDLDLASEKVEDYMTPHPTTIHENETILKVLQFMELGAFRHVIIVDKDEKVKSIISMKDMMSYILKTIQSKGL